MAISEKSNEIMADAQRAVKGEISLEEFEVKYPLNELEVAYYQLAADKDSGYYKLIEKTIEKKKLDSSAQRVQNACGPLAKDQCDQMVSASQLYSDKNVFLDIPYSDYDDCENALRELLKEVGLNGIAAKDKLTSNDVLCKVCRMIKTCKYGISDLSTGSNSVSYEYGLMHGLGMKVCLILREKSKSFTDVAGLEYAPPYLGLRSLKISVAKWLRDNVEEADLRKINEIIEKEEKELKSKGDITLSEISKASIVSAERNEEKKIEQINKLVDKANKQKSQTKGYPTRTLIAVPSKAQKKVVSLKELFKQKDNFILSPRSPHEFPCSSHKLGNSQHALIYYTEFNGLDGSHRFLYVSMDDEGVLYCEETIFERGAKSTFGDIKETDPVINVIFTLDRLYKFILFAENFYSTIKYSGGIDLHYNFNNVKNFHLTITDDFGFAVAIGKNTHNDNILISKPVSQGELRDNQKNLILDIYEDFRFYGGAKEEAFARNVTETHLEKAKMIPRKQDMCLDCQKHQANNPEASNP
jgi:hypothetical protein